MKIRNFFLILIIVLSFVLRVVNLDKFPALNADEAAIGYNAYSLLHTGKDEYGVVLPLAFKSFGDFKPGLYFYFVLPFIFILGLSEWAVRLPSAFLGVGEVVLIYFLAKQIFKDKYTPIISALFLAISPWAIHFSRGGWETNAATFFITLGVYLFCRFLDLEKIKFLFWSLVSFLTSMYLYQGPRLVAPVFFFFLLAVYFRKIFSSFKKYNLKILLGLVGVLIVLSVPLLLQFTSGGGSARFEGLSIFSDKGPESRINQLRGEHPDPGSKMSVVLHNKITAYAPSFLGHYLDHFSANFLFINGDPIIRNKVPETGQFFLLQALFLIIGIFSLIKYKENKKVILFLWLLVGPLASSLTYQTPHAVRALNMVIPFTIIMAFGLNIIVESVQRYKAKYVVFTLLALILTFEFTHYLEEYYVHLPQRYPLASQYGFGEMVSKLQKYQNNYEKVVITDRYDQPYILVLFFEKYDPRKYQPQAKLTERDKFNFGTVRAFDKYEFRQIKPEEVTKNKTLFIGTDAEIPVNAKIIDKVVFPNGEDAFVFAEGGK